MKILITYDFLSTKASLGKQLSNSLSFIKKVLVPLDVEVTIDNGNIVISTITIIVITITTIMSMLLMKHCGESIGVIT